MLQLLRGIAGWLLKAEKLAYKEHIKHKTVGSAHTRKLLKKFNQNFVRNAHVRVSC